MQQCDLQYVPLDGRPSPRSASFGTVADDQSCELNQDATGAVLMPETILIETTRRRLGKSPVPHLPAVFLWYFVI